MDDSECGAFVDILLEGRDGRLGLAVRVLRDKWLKSETPKYRLKLIPRVPELVVLTLEACLFELRYSNHRCR